MSFFGYNGGMTEAAIVIQAGGESSRMGEDKGLMLFDGKPLVLNIQEQVAGLQKPLIIISNSPEKYREFCAPVFTDVLPGIGALGGLMTALTYSPAESCLLLACDMPFVQAGLVDALLGKARDADVVIPIYNGRPEPFRAVYRRTCLGPVKEMIQMGKRRMISFFDQVSVIYIEEDTVIQLDPEGRSFVNVNTKEDLERANRLLEINRSE
jgi:molybdopterin-guanine dinucleotide biosynthesis protein A